MDANEDVLIRAFIIRERRPRWLQCLQSAKKRSQFLDRLNHCRDFDGRFIGSVPSNTDVGHLLASRGAPAECFVVSSSREIDGRTMPLLEAIEAAQLSGWGTLIGCIPDRLAYYYDECGERRFLLERGD